MTKEKPFKKIIDAITGEEIIVELTDEEIAEIAEAEIASKKRLKEEETAKLASEEKRQEILNRLGLTAEEAALLLG